MSDFQFLKNPVSGKWVISAPRRSHRPDGEHHELPCPFCPGQEANDEVYRVANGNGGWAIRSIANKFPFTPYHEVIIHSTDHTRSFDTLPQTQVDLIIHTYRQRYNVHSEQGQVYIFHNHGHAAGESLYHPHSQLVVVPNDIKLDIPLLPHINWNTKVGEAIPWFTQKWWGWPDESQKEGGGGGTEEALLTEHFYIFCPSISEWPDEVWIAPKKAGEFFGDINDAQLKDFSFTLTRLVQIFDFRHGREFPFNFYIYPGKNWYLRLIPRIKVLGGFELGTGVMVNTQEPEKTIAFIKEHFYQPNWEKIKGEHKASYRKKV
jgi:UDPglucose--hexose-1-phosphate uridylyltransferase